MLIRGHLTLNSDLSDEELQEISARSDLRSFMVRYVTFRWDDGEIGLRIIAMHGTYY